jgi:hypothetical protein
MLLSTSSCPDTGISFLARDLRSMQSNHCSRTDPDIKMRTAQSIGEAMPRASGNSILIATQFGIQDLHLPLFIGLTTYTSVIVISGPSLISRVLPSYPSTSLFGLSSIGILPVHRQDGITSLADSKESQNEYQHMHMLDANR